MTLKIKYIQDENIIVIIAGLFFLAFIIWRIRLLEIKELKKSKEEESSEFYSTSKMYKWRVYIIAGLGIIFFLLEILRRINREIFG